MILNSLLDDNLAELFIFNVLNSLLDNFYLAELLSTWWLKPSWTLYLMTFNLAELSTWWLDLTELSTWWI